jgi:hypothetical protein
MGNIQGITFNTLAELLDYLGEEQREVVLFLREIILECIPNCKEKLAYNVPFFYGHSRICYLWPAAVPGGEVAKGVAIGFCKNDSFLDATFETTPFASKSVFSTVSAIDVALLRQQIYQAVLIDNQIVKAKRRKIQ